ncbi:Cof subfamily protein (haloacid dehalogenase superfamily) [Weissella uvarum]|uniref:Cof-type HAD-IIB family hydrolase n=1 Tax=Weissella uvarum TaxID=1479233 RepID=UPI001960C159|nr:Cof-type HAD-IIB family hydrolase [Weissella uvarum]MBM7617655.1 Cof subfamily protein (haloacid dehalogenase superfamily) [Weissella uvarum]MCM0596004.1 Cof-type HAD-IIB family hydrolase [Weissella uvarum]
MIKLIAIDIDDTLVNTSKEITDHVKKSVQAATAAGIKIVLTTGRPVRGVQNYLKTLGLDNQADQYVIAYNGSVVETTTGEVIFSKEVGMPAYQEMTKLGDAWGDVLVQAEMLDDIYTTSHDINPMASRESYFMGMPIKVRAMEEMPEDGDYVKVMLIGEVAKMDDISAKMPQDIQDKYTIVRSDQYFIEIINKEASKGAGLRALADHLGISMDETMAIGDQQNDMSMVEAAGFGVAMGNAIDDLKAAADAVTTTQDEDGVGVAIDKYVLDN